MGSAFLGLLGFRVLGGYWGFRGRLLVRLVETCSPSAAQPSTLRFRQLNRYPAGPNFRFWFPAFFGGEGAVLCDEV